ncbi:HNH endonuclease signature motif containing protein [Nocardioides sp. Kera G14]|uniref:HNH endonuclease signature motif containing protein n=1 Tax=Nocardioides sp. Kera G14 TaxID=2884264 RepID=UPI001D124A95|nr:HNH endonuclease signature motif containing protein [Nocardioides sp. Kera G14]UDY24903.1 HNH endonuclease [Nocardioides sp. Kera G14]
MPHNALDLAVALDAVDDDASALTLMRESQQRIREEEVLQIATAARFASFHEVDQWWRGASQLDEAPGAERALLLGGDGSPWIEEFAVMEFAAATGRSTMSARAYLGGALALVHRLPQTWRQVQAGRVDGWRARRIAEATMSVSQEAAAWIDEQIAPRAQQVGVRTLDRVVEEARARFNPEELVDDEVGDLDGRHVDIRIGQNPSGRAATTPLEAELDTDDAIALKETLHDVAEQITDTGEPLAVRLAKALGMLARGQVMFLNQSITDDGPKVSVDVPQLPVTVRVAEGDTVATVHTLTGQRIGMLSIPQLETWFSRMKPVIRPVLDLNDEAVSHARFGGPSLREKVIEVNQKCVFPFCERPAEACDQDHIEEWVDPKDGGPPGQTSRSKLACLCRTHHRTKTFTPWRYREIRPGIYEWTSPQGFLFEVTPQGTIDLGRSVAA